MKLTFRLTCKNGEKSVVVYGKVRNALQQLVNELSVPNPPPPNLEDTHIYVEVTAGKDVNPPQAPLPTSAGPFANPADLVSSRCPKNKAERQAWWNLHNAGWMVTKRGWPDFFCLKDKSLAVVEVKKSRGYTLKTQQRLVMRALAAFGVPCYRWDPETGYDRIGLEKPTENHYDNPPSNLETADDQTKDDTPF